jgi:hypothetical protein
MYTSKSGRKQAAYAKASAEENDEDAVAEDNDEKAEEKEAELKVRS